MIPYNTSEIKLRDLFKTTQYKDEITSSFQGLSDLVHAGYVWCWPSKNVDMILKFNNVLGSNMMI